MKNNLRYWLIPGFVMLALLLAAGGVLAQNASLHEAPAELHETAATVHQDHPAEEHGDTHAAHAEGHEGEHHEEHPPEVPDFLFILKMNTSGAVSKFIGAIRVPFYSILVACLLAWGISWAVRRLNMIPDRRQGIVELYAEIIDNFVCSVIGKEIGRIYVPFIATLGIYIWVMNLFCLIPLMMSPTSAMLQTFGLSIPVFFYVQYTAIKYQGVGGYLYHLAGEPRDLIGYVLAPLFFPLHVMGELIKPVSLALRLHGNILGEDILLGVFSMLGIMLIQACGWHDPWIGIPLHIPMIALVLLGSSIQAVVFVSLTTIYLYLVLPHHDHAEEHAHQSAH